jgi:thymidylate synthase ThyX
VLKSTILLFFSYGIIEKTEESKVADTDYLDTSGEHIEITQAGYDFLDSAVTDSHGAVYAFTGENISGTTAAAAMARLSRSQHDMRVTILKEFAIDGKDEALLRRVVTMYGDDSVQQLVGLHVVVENASNLLTKYIEWGRLASYLEQSTRYIFYDEKDKNGKYRYYTPSELSDDDTAKYDEVMDSIFDGYSTIVHKLVEHISSNSDTSEKERDGAWKMAVRAQACDAARALLPVATGSTVGIFASAQALEAMIMRLRAHSNEEAQRCGDAILKQVRGAVPTFFERADKPERGGGTSAYLAVTKEAVASAIAKNLPEVDELVSEPMNSRLVSYSPKNELSLVADIVYDNSKLSLSAIADVVTKLDESKQNDIFDSYFGERLNRRHRPGRALENAHYTFDIVCDYGIFRDLQRHRIVDDLRWQKLTPELGYDVPQLVKDAGLEDDFNQLFIQSINLYDDLLSLYGNEIAQYATLLGHRMRWRISFNAREAFHLLELRTAPQGHPGYRKLGKMMYDQIAQVHPRLAKHMVFINQDEDPALTRLAAERATQRKLDALS